MVWFWSDDLARALLDSGLTEPDRVGEWLDKPLAFAASAGEDGLSVGCRILGIDEVSGVA